MPRQYRDAGAAGRRARRWYDWTSLVDGDVAGAYGRDIEERRARDEALAADEERLRQARKPETIG